MPYINLAKGTFGAPGIDDLEERLNLGAVLFRYQTVTTTDTHVKGEVRIALGTRNLGLDIIPVTAIPIGLRTPPPHVLTYYDLGRKEWRCFDRNHLIDYEEWLYVENT